MKTINRSLAIIVLVLAAVAGFGFKGCSEKQQNDFRKGVRVGAGIARGVNDDVGAYCRAGFLKPESCDKAKPIIDRVSNIATRADKFVKEHPKLTLESKEEALALADDLIKELDALEADGVIEFKSPDKRRNFLLGLAFARSTVRGARIWIEEAPIEPTPSPSPQ